MISFVCHFNSDFEIFLHRNCFSKSIDQFVCSKASENASESECVVKLTIGIWRFFSISHVCNSNGLRKLRREKHGCICLFGISGPTKTISIENKQNSKYFSSVGNDLVHHS